VQLGARNAIHLGYSTTMDPVAFVKNLNLLFNFLLRDIIDGRAKDYQAYSPAALYVC
jgi:hypothetical protein